MPIAFLMCKTCNEFRGKSTREFDRTEKPMPTDFEAIPPQPPIDSDAAPKCVTCSSILIWQFAAPQSAHTATGGANGASRGHDSSSVSTAGAVTTLFAADEGEDILEAKHLRADCYVFITTRRVVAVDIAAMLMDKEMR